MAMNSCPPIRMSNGNVIEDPVGQALRFVGSDGSYQLYDSAPVAQDDTLTESDVRVANKFVARMSSAVITGILARRVDIDAALKRIPARSSLTDAESAIPWDALHALIAAFDDVPAVGLARITKVLHRKRPALIPILDSVVEGYLVGIERPPPGSRADRAVALTRTYKREMDLNREALACLRLRLTAHGINLTECRLFDVFAWMYSGLYVPLINRPAREMNAALLERPQRADRVSLGAPNARRGCVCLPGPRE